MSNLFERIKTAITADLHEALDNKEQKNPVSLLNQYLRQCEQEVEKVSKLIERQYLLTEEFTREYQRAVELAEKRKQQAVVASNAGETELYDFVSGEQSQYEERATRLKVSMTQANEQLTVLEQKYEEMKHQLKEMQLKKMELMGRENIARANHRMNTMLDNSSQVNESASRFKDMESYLDRLEKQVNTSYYRNTIDARIAQLEKEMKNEDSRSLS